MGDHFGTRRWIAALRSQRLAGRNDGVYRHSRIGGSPVLARGWIPAYAGMTGSGAGMTGGGAGMTAFTSGQRPHFQGEALTFVTARREAIKPPEGGPSPQEHSALLTKSLASSGERHQPFFWMTLWAGVAGVSRFAFWMYCIDSERLWF